MTYRVQISPKPIVVDHSGLPVVGAWVLEIAFPGEAIETPAGRMNVVVGAGVAKIMVANEMIRGVSLC